MSQWVDASGDQWRFSTASGSWLRLVSGSWMPAALPPGGLRKITSGVTVTSTVVAPPWTDCESSADAPQWVDAQGDPWRHHPTTGVWQKLIGQTWTNSAPPSGGLRKIGESADYTPDVVVVETMGPRGPIGLTGPIGPGFNGVLEVIDQEQDGVATTFLLSNAPDLTQTVQVFRNGLLEMPGYSYSVTSTSVTFTTPPLSNDVLTVVYQKAQ
jgi:hypothetical protein